MSLNNTLVFISLILSILYFSPNTLADLNIFKQEYHYLPALEYYDCSQYPFQEVDINLIEGGRLQNIGKKTSSAFIKGSQISIAASSLGDFQGLNIQLYNEDKSELFLSQQHLNDTIYFESNSLSSRSFIEGYHLPVFSLQLCKDAPPSPYFACLEFGYLKKIKLMKDIVLKAVSAKLAKFMSYNQEENVAMNHKMILLEDPSRWQYQKIYIEWNNESDVFTYIQTEDHKFYPVSIMAGKLDVNRFGIFRGTQNMIFENFNLDNKSSNSNSKTLRTEIWLNHNNCKKF